MLRLSGNSLSVKTASQNAMERAIRSLALRASCKGSKLLKSDIPKVLPSDGVALAIMQPPPKINEMRLRLEIFALGNWFGGARNSDAKYFSRTARVSIY